MKTLILNGSPRKNGDTATILNKLKANLKGEIIEYSAYYDKISPCTDCRYCWTNPGCSIDDDMLDIYDITDGADNIVLASPLYFAELTGSLLGLVSRYQTYYARDFIRCEQIKHRKRNGVLILTGGGSGGENHAEKTAKMIFKTINAEYVGKILSLNTDTLPSIKDEAAMKSTVEIAEMLNRLYTE